VEDKIMICDKCKNIICMQAFITTSCERCGKDIVTGHIPGYRICIECAKYSGDCQQCGENIEDNEVK